MRWSGYCRTAPPCWCPAAPTRRRRSMPTRRTPGSGCCPAPAASRDTCCAWRPPPARLPWHEPPAPWPCSATSFRSRRRSPTTARLPRAARTSGPAPCSLRTTPFGSGTGTSGLGVPAFSRCRHRTRSRRPTPRHRLPSRSTSPVRRGRAWSRRACRCWTTAVPSSRPGARRSDWARTASTSCSFPPRGASTRSTAGTASSPRSTTTTTTPRQSARTAGGWWHHAATRPVRTGRPPLSCGSTRSTQP